MKKLLFPLIILGSVVSLQCVRAAEKTLSHKKFLQTIRTGNVELIEEMIKNGADVNQADIDGWTPLHVAAYNGHDKVVQLLINSGADPIVAFDMLVGNDKKLIIKADAQRLKNKIVNEVLFQKKKDIHLLLCLAREYDEKSFFFPDYLPLDMFKLIISEIDDLLPYLMSLSSFEYAFMLAEEFYKANQPKDSGNTEIVKTLAKLYNKLKSDELNPVSVPNPTTETGIALMQALEKELASFDSK